MPWKEPFIAAEVPNTHCRFAIDEFNHFIGQDIRLDPVMLDKATSIETLLEFYMGKNTPDRQEFIINNLKVELDVVEKN